MDQTSGQIELSQTFDTYKSSVNFDEFTSKPLPAGKIVIAACKDECTKNLSEGGRKWFSKIGSWEIWNLKYRESFVIIATTAEGDDETSSSSFIQANEKRSPCSTKISAFASQVFILNNDISAVLEEQINSGSYVVK